MTESYWQRDAGWSDRWVDAALPARVDIAVIGGGFAGLMTAIRIREQAPSLSVCVLEAERVGFGASGRNAGFLSPLAAPVWLLGAKRSVDQAWGAARINSEVHAIARWIGEHVAECELRPARLALQAESRISDSALREFAAAVTLTGLEHSVGPSRARPGHLVLDMAAYTLHPYRLVRGLAEHAVSRGVRICERARVQALDGQRIRLASGEVTASTIVLCTNGYTPTIDIGDRVRAMVVHSLMSASAPLAVPPLRDGDFTVEMNTSQAYHRMHGDRVIYGGIDKLRAPDDGDFVRLAKLMRHSFPESEVSIAEQWSGCFQTTTTGLPVIRRSATNPALVLNVAYGGTGVALSLACAKLAASVATSTPLPPDDARLLSMIQSTRISVVDSVRAMARIAGRFVQPWRTS